MIIITVLAHTSIMLHNYPFIFVVRTFNIYSFSNDYPHFTHEGTKFLSSGCLT